MEKNTKKIVITLFISTLILFSSNNAVISLEEKTTSKNQEELLVLVTGFGPFGNHSINPSQIIAEQLNGTKIRNTTIYGLTLPVDFEKTLNVTKKVIQNLSPEIIISLGLAAGYKKIHIEKIGLNLKRIENKKGNIIFRKISPKDPLIRLSTIPTFKIAKNLREKNIPARQGFYAGIYVCNTQLYGILNYIQKNNLNIQYGFIHLPQCQKQDPNGLPLELLCETVNITINTTIENRLN
ncbi:MAG: hypothetical protein V5A68_05710 [Candidatus Thermoplasmatota archaeon]